MYTKLNYKIMRPEDSNIPTSYFIRYALSKCIKYETAHEMFLNAIVASPSYILIVGVKKKQASLLLKSLEGRTYKEKKLDNLTYIIQGNSDDILETDNGYVSSDRVDLVQIIPDIHVLYEKISCGQTIYRTYMIPKHGIHIDSLTK